MAEQLTLDQFSWHTTHQVGHYRAPWHFAAAPTPDTPTPRQGDLVPAWRCCHCGALEMTPYALWIGHGCAPRLDGCATTCHKRPKPRPMHPYRMDAHWIPPTEDRP